MHQELGELELRFRHRNPMLGDETRRHSGSSSLVGGDLGGDSNPRIQHSEIQYIHLKADDDVVLVGGKPYVTLVSLYQTLMQQPYLSDSDFRLLASEYRALEAAIDEAHKAQPALVRGSNVHWDEVEDPNGL